MEQQGLINRLWKLGAFWSYDPKANIPDQVLIEQCLRWGDVEEIQILFSCFSKEIIQEVWKEKMLPDKGIYPHNYYLALIFFQIPNPKEYILPLQTRLSRYERLRQFTS